MKAKFVLEIVFASVLALISLIAFIVSVCDVSDIVGSFFSIISSIIVFFASTAFITVKVMRKVNSNKES